jgi:ribosomal protein S18 acetylase RimI-like enzyme
VTSWQIRPAVPSDLPTLSRIFREAALSNDGDRPDLLAHPEVLVFGPEGVDEGRTRVAVGPDGVLVGFVTELIAAGILEVEDLFVDPAFQRQGAAQQLIADLAVSARERGFRRLEVVGNQHALEFYRQAGFIQDGEARTQFGYAPHLFRELDPAPG